MTRSELIEALAYRAKHLTPADTKVATDTIIEAMTSSLADGGRIEIRGFGSFSVTYRAPRIGRNRKSGEVVQVPGKVAPRFKMGKDMQERVNKKI